MIGLSRVKSGGPRFGLAVADHASDNERRVVERGTEGVAQAVAELAALVDRARRLGRDVARDAAREGELLEEPLQSFRVLRDGGIQLAVRSLEVGVRDERGAAVSRPGDVDDVEAVLPDYFEPLLHVRVIDGRPSVRWQHPGAAGTCVVLTDAQVLGREPPDILLSMLQ